MADGLSRQPGEVGRHDKGDIWDSGSGSYILQDPVVFSDVEDWLQVLLPHLVLMGWLKAIKMVLSFGHPVVALACKRYSRQYLDHGDYANQRHTAHLCASCGHKWAIV